MTRPEAGDSWGNLPADWQDEHERNAWQGFTPWRPSDTPKPATPAAPKSTSASQEPNRYSSSREYREGDRVNATRSLGGILGGAVPAGTEGRVTGIEHGLLETRMTVTFENGYTEDVKADDVRYNSGWY